MPTISPNCCNKSRATLPRAGRGSAHARTRESAISSKRANPMNGIIYIIGLVVVVVAVLSFFGFR